MNTQTSEATLTGQTLENQQLTFDVVVDCGNANVKTTLVRGGSIVRTEYFGSRIRFTNSNDVNGAWGGFTLGSKSVHVGDNCGETGDVINIGSDAQGKLKYLTYLLAGACSVLHRSIPVGSHLRFHILTLSLDANKQVQAALQPLTELKVNDVELKYTVELARLLPEGVGCSFYVASVFKKAKAISVLDIGGGTMNLSSYTIANTGEPERRNFTFEGTGILKFKDELASFIKLTTTNGQVNETLVEYALAQNSSLLMDGTDISKPLAQAVESWLNLPKVQNILMKARNILATGGYVGCCGGGFKITAVREAIVKSLIGAEPSEDLAARLLVPEEANVLGVLGVAKAISSKARNLQKKLSKERKQQEKQADATPENKQPTTSTPESVATVPTASESEQPTSIGTNEPSALGVATELQQPALVETTAN